MKRQPRLAGTRPLIVLPDEHLDQSYREIEHADQASEFLRGVTCGIACTLLPVALFALWRIVA